MAEFGRPDALLLQETFMTESTGIEHRGTVKGYVMTAQSKDRYMKEKKEKSRYVNRHGVGTLLKEELTKRSKFIESGSDRVLAQKIYMGKRTLLLINSYCPTRDQSMQGLRDFEECLSRISGLIAEHCGKDCSFALYADWNLCPVKHAKDKKRIKAMSNFLKTINGVYYVPSVPTFSDRKLGGACSWLDGLITSKDVKVNTMISLDNEYFPESNSTHCPLLMQITVKGKGEQEGKRRIKKDPAYPCYPKVNWKNVHMEIYQKLSKVLVDYTLKVMEDCPWQSRARAFTDCLARAAYLATMEKEENEEEMEERHRQEQKQLLLIKKRLSYKKIREKRQKLRKIFPEEMSTQERVKNHPNSRTVRELLEEEKTRRTLNIKIRKIDRYSVWLKEKKRVDRLNKDLEKGDSSSFFKILETYKGEVSDEFPDCLIVEGKMYTGSEVLRGFKEMAYAQSRKEMMFVDDIPEEFTMIKKFNETYRKLIEEDDKEIRWISDEEIMKEVKKVRDNKAPDLANFGKENVTKNSKYIEGIFCGFVRDMCEDPTRYSSLLTSLSVASFLYKGKNKNREDPTSYRKISIGSFYNKITDKIFAEETQRCAKENQPPLQYGFTSGVNFLLCSVLRESLIRKAVKEKKAPLLLACDVKNAFSKTSRECQMYELYNAGERSKIWKYSQHTYLNTYTVLKHGKEYSDMVEEMCGSKQGGALLITKASTPLSSSSYSGVD